MLIRQRTILRLIEKANQPMSRTVVFKLAFLLRHETVLAEDSTFYDFLPYRFGPYSFAMHREIEALVSYGYLDGRSSDLGTSFVLGNTPNEYELPAAVDAAVDSVLRRYAGVCQSDLVRDVYARYPWYAINSELRKLVSTPLPRRGDATLAVYTIGYHRTSIDSFANRLLEEGVRSVVDVRANPVSRKYGFAGSSLRSICRKVGLGYHHFPRLGIPSANRKGVSGAAAFSALFSSYERNTLCSNTADVAAVSALMKCSPSVLLCAEQNASECHRSRLAVAVANTTGLPVIDL
jgi:uncharacterized protein (DUF488 family)